ncbi:hypothetical protein Mal52_37130 [Symmachiella dynata]|uniref:Uncharacterized protein n=1 Tax=Symmachiella dynata TaxID=2527995 RepID=A0A517ZRV4_9PLAN|nr:hypothetical protein [Symmachiella dynata]QDU45222.1 hypothetical protein Mal52_37130 [Symmachiella dynata]
MSDSLLDKYVGKRSESQDTPSQPETDGFEDCGAFGWLRGVRDHAIMLEIRHKNGRITALGYAWLDSAEFDPSEGITLRFSGRTVKIIGRNLNGEVRPNIRLFDGLVRHRVPWIQEADGSANLQAPQGAAIIEEIAVK